MAIGMALVGALCVAYGISVMMIWSGSSFFAVWLALGALLLGGAFAVNAGWWEAAPLPLRRTVEVVVCAALAICVVTQGLAASCFGAKGEEGLDAVIVLGAQVREGGPTIVLKNRLDTAADYLAANPGTRCIVSGGKGSNEPEPEAHVMARYLEERGVDPKRIQVEDESRNTLGNIKNSMKLVDAERERVGIITNNFHVFRATAIARKQGFAQVCGIAAPSAPWYLPNNLLRETFGIAKDFALGNL